jgi:TonB-linked SusC/RagA family outer membrane protein
MNFKCLYKKRKNYSLVITVFLSFLMSSVYAQKTPVSGTVIDDTGVVMIGVNVVEKGTTNGVTTDLDGKFTIQVAGPKSTIVFSYIGYESFSQVVGDKKSMSIVLKSTANKLDDVVVIGYGTSKKSDLTGSVTSVTGEELKKLAMASVAETLTGRVAGMQVTSTEGSPDAEIKMRIRGGGSITQDSTPLLIVDGFPVNTISDISPSDIENISVLKDASSTAIYGARGANGVIIITTKKGGKEGGKVSVSYNTFYGTKKLAETIDVLGAQDYANWQYEYAQLQSDLPSYENYFGPWQPNQYVNTPTTNWQKEIFGRAGSVQNHDLGIRGGTDKLNYNFNFTRYDEKAIMIGSDFKRNNLSLNLRSKASEKVDLSFTVRYSDTEINGGGTNEQKEVSSADSRFKHVVGYAPFYVPGLTSDDTDEQVAGNLVYPFIAVSDTDREQKRKNYNMSGGFSWKIIKNLQLKSDFGLDNYKYSDYRFYGRSTYYAGNIPLVENQGKPSIVMTYRNEVKFRNSNTLNYDFKDLLSDNHKLKILVGEESLNYKSNTLTNTIHGFPLFFSFDNAINLSALGKPFSVDNYVSPDDNLLSFFGRVNYDFKNRYLFTATVRADGSSKFLDGNRWGYFPSAAVAWKVNEEAFLKDVSWLKSLKVRLSYGQSGNNNIPTGQTIPTFIPGTSSWINNVTNFWSATSVLSNPDLKWETTITQNLGVDYELFNGRISGSVETYKNVTKDVLINFPISGSSGYISQYRNMGEIQNTGIETSINVIALDRKNYGASASFNIGFNKGRINSLGVMNDFKQATNWASTQIGSDYLVAVGNPIGLMYGYQSDGRYEVSDFNYVGGAYVLKPGVASASTIVGPIQPGTMKLKDINGDGVVNVNDQTVIGDANPVHTGGIVLNANAYGFDLSAAFNWSYGNDVYNANKIESTTTNSKYRNLSSDMEAGVRWNNMDANGQLVTDPTQLAALNANTTMWSPAMQRYVFSDWAVEDGSFIRLNTLTLGYTLPNELISKIGLAKLRFYLTGNNVFILTKYSGLDPEVSTRRNTPLTPGVDYSPYPRSRQFVFGLNLNF